MKVGLSLSFCVRDIIEKRVALDEIKFISAGTKAPTPEDWQEVLETYKRIYWHKDPEEAETYFWRLLNTGRIIQPRLEGLKPCSMHGGREMSHWIEEEEYNERMQQTQRQFDY